MSKIIECAPKLRFPGFSGNWKLKRLGDYLQPYIERVPAQTDLQIFSSTREGLKPQNEYYSNRELANEGEYGVVPPGYFVYRHMSDDSTFKFNINKLGISLAVSKEYPVFTTKDLNSRFLLLKLNSGSDFKKYAVMQKMGGTRTRLYFKNLADWHVLLPEHSEQIKIARVFDLLNDKKYNLNSKLEKFQQLKTGVLQKIFLYEGIFKKDDGTEFPEWEEKSLGQLGSFIGGGTPSTEIPEFWQGKIPWISSSDLTDGDITEVSISRFISETAIKHSATKLVPANSILIVSRVGLGKLAITNQAVCTSQDFSNFIPENCNPLFIAYLLRFNRHKLLSLAQGTSIKGFTNGDLANLKLMVPCLAEQKKIARLLSVYDQKINAIKQQIKKLESFKQGLLQQMFV